jgi:hypothetical protein
MRDGHVAFETAYRHHTLLRIECAMQGYAEHESLHHLILKLRAPHDRIQILPTNWKGGQVRLPSRRNRYRSRHPRSEQVHESDEAEQKSDEAVDQ